MLRIFYCALALCLFIYIEVDETEINNNSLSFLLIILGIVNVTFFMRKEHEIKLRSQFFKHSTFAIVGLLIVNFQYYVDILLGNVSKDYDFVFVNENLIKRTFVVALVGLIMFFVGYLSFRKSVRSDENHNITEFAYKTHLLEVMLIVILLLFFANLDLAYVFGGYGEIDLDSTMNYLTVFINVLVTAIIIQKSRNYIIEKRTGLSLHKYIQKLGFSVNVTVLLYLCVVVLSGDRGPIISYSLLYLAAYYFTTKRKLALRNGIILLFGGATLIAILGIARQQGSSLSFGEKLKIAFESEDHLRLEDSFLPQTQELAGSAKPLHHAIDYIPERHDYLYGRFQFQQISAAIPFFSIINNFIFQDNSKKYAGSASFVTWIFQGDHPTYGNGTSVIADFYFDFGLFGVVLGMFMFGYLMRFAEMEMYTRVLPNLFSTVFFIVYITAAVYIARSSFFFEFRSVIWIIVVLKLNTQFSNNRILC